MELVDFILDSDILGYLDPFALVVIWGLVDAFKRFDKTMSQTRRTTTDRRRRADDHGRARAFYPFLPFLVSGIWFATLAAIGDSLDAQRLVLDIGGHGAFAGSGYAMTKRVRQALSGRSK